MTISNDSRTRIKKVFEPIALGMGRLGLTPDGLTVIGFAITVVGAVLIAMQQWVLGGIIVFGGGVFDMFDGTLARATGQASPLGAFMDSVFDRAGEVVVYIGIVAGLQSIGVADGTLIAAAALGSAVLVSYTRAKSDGLGFTAGTGMAAVGVMPREVRLVVLSLGLILGGILGMDFGEIIVFLGIIAGLQGAGAADVPILVAVAAMGASIMVSYTRAKSDGLGFSSGTGMAAVGIMPREIRLVIISLGIVLAGTGLGLGALQFALGVVLVGATATVIQRILHVRSQARQRSTQIQ